MKIDEYVNPMDELNDSNSNYPNWRIKGKHNDAKRKELEEKFGRFIDTGSIDEMKGIETARITASEHAKSLIKHSGILAKKQRRLMLLLVDYKVHKKVEIINRVKTTRKGLKSLVRDTRRKVGKMGFIIKGIYKAPGGYQLFKKHTSSR